MSERVLYDLVANRPEQRFSPYCFRVKLALAHKQLPWRSELVRFTDKDKLAFSGQPLVPVLIDLDGTVVSDSFRILQHLESRYPEQPLLVEADHSLPFLRAWVDRSLTVAAFKLLAPKIHALLQGEDADYFRSSREQRLGQSLEAVANDAPRYAKILHTTLEPLRLLLGQQDCVSGEQPGAGDVLVLATLLWFEGVTGAAMLPADDPISAWRSRQQPWVEQMLQMSERFQ